jgi:hypothetical protein
MTTLFGDLSPLVPLPLGIGEGKGEEKERGVCTPLRHPVWGLLKSPSILLYERGEKEGYNSEKGLTVIVMVGYINMYV